MTPTPFTTAGIRKLHDWTHASLTLVLDYLSTLSAADYQRPLPDFGFPTLQAQVVHIFNCETFWVHVLLGQPVADRDPSACPTVGDARAFQQQVCEQTRAYLASLTDEALNSDADLHFADGDVAVRTPALVLHHLLTHAFHHKGQVAAMCRALGHPMPDTDLNQFE